MHILRGIGTTFCVKFQRARLKFHTKFWTNTSQNMHFTDFNVSVWLMMSFNCDVISLSEKGPCITMGKIIMLYSNGKDHRMYPQTIHTFQRFGFVVVCCLVSLSICSRVISLILKQSYNYCTVSQATMKDMDKYFPCKYITYKMWSR